MFIYKAPRMLWDRLVLINLTSLLPSLSVLWTVGWCLRREKWASPLLLAAILVSQGQGLGSKQLFERRAIHLSRDFWTLMPSNSLLFKQAVCVTENTQVKPDLENNSLFNADFNWASGGKAGGNTEGSFTTPVGSRKGNFCSRALELSPRAYTQQWVWWPLHQK